MHMRSLEVANTNYRFACFSPTTSKFESETACGVQTYVSLRNQASYEGFDPVYLGVALLSTAKQLYQTPKNGTAFEWLASTSDKSQFNVDILAGSPLVREGIDAGLTPEAIRASWKPALAKFKAQRAQYLVY